MEDKASQLMIGWTTCGNEATAQKLAQQAVAGKLAACVQVSGPVTSHYVWEGKAERTQEWSLRFKFPARNLENLKAWLIEQHPYDCPQWYAIAANDVHQPYLDWALKNT